MKAVGVIPARWGSTRFPGKSLADIAGKPLVCRVVESARKAAKLADVIVATDDRRIAEAVSLSGVRAVMTKEDHQSGTDRIAEAVEGISADIVVNIQGDEPLIDPALIDRLVEKLEESPAWDMATAAAPVRDEDTLLKPQVVKVVCDAGGGALYFSRSVIPFVRDGSPGDNIQLYRRHIGIYAYRKEFLARMVAHAPCELELAEKLEQLRAMYIGGRIAVVETEEAGGGVDTPADVEAVVEELRRRGAC